MDLGIGLAASVFVAGVLSFFSPCILPILPLYIGYFSADVSEDAASPWPRVLRTLAFVLGISVVYFTLGLGAGFAGSFISEPLFALFCGIFIVLMGMFMAGIVSIPVLERTKVLSRSRRFRMNMVGAFLLGFFFSFGWTPCVGPVLASILGLSLTGGNALAGGILLLIYAMGLGVPFIVMSLAYDLLIGSVRAIYPYLGRIRTAGGILIIAMGIWMIASVAPRLTGVSGYGEAAAQHTGSDAAAGIDAAAGADGDLPAGNTLSGATVSVSDWEGKIVYLKFWASWCSVCMSGMDEFIDLCDTYRDDGDVVIYSIVAPSVYGEMDRESFTEWAVSRGIGFPVLFDEGGALTYALGLRAYPTSVFIDQSQEVRAIYTGHMDNDLITQYIDALKES